MLVKFLLTPRRDANPSPASSAWIRQAAAIVICVAVWAWTENGAQALSLVLPDAAAQGDLIVGRAIPPATILVDGNPVPVGANGQFVFGVPRDQKTGMAVTASMAGVTARRTVAIQARPWKIQSINGLPDKYVTPDPETEKRIDADIRQIRSVRQSPSHADPFFLNQGFASPIKGEITGVFGSQRILNGKPKSPHQGVDMAAPKGTVVCAPADGTVCLVNPDMVLTGKTLMVDHGLGVRSILIHLNTIDVRHGARVRQGDPIATVGMTGRATGPHLHWGVNAGETAVDPQKLLGRTFLR